MNGMKAHVLWRCGSGRCYAGGLLGFPVSNHDSDKRISVVPENTDTELVNDIGDDGSLDADSNCFPTASLTISVMSFESGLSRAPPLQGLYVNNFRMGSSVGDVLPLFQPVRGLQICRFGGQCSPLRPTQITGATLQSSGSYGSQKTGTSEMLGVGSSLQDDSIPTSPCGDGVLLNKNQISMYRPLNSHGSSRFRGISPAQNDSTAADLPELSSPISISSGVTVSIPRSSDMIGSKLYGLNSADTPRYSRLSATQDYTLNGANNLNSAQRSRGLLYNVNGVQNSDNGLSAGTEVGSQMPGGVSPGSNKSLPNRDVDNNRATTLNNFRRDTEDPFDLTQSSSLASGIAGSASSALTEIDGDDCRSDGRLAVRNIVMVTRSCNEHCGNSHEAFLSGVERRPSFRLLVDKTNNLIIARFHLICATRTIELNLRIVSEI